MKVTLHHILWVIIIAIFAQGCATVTQLSKEPVTSDRITFMIPKNVNINSNDSLKGLRFLDKIQRGRPDSPDSLITPISGVETTAGYFRDAMTCTFYNGEINQGVNNGQRFISSVTYTIAINVSENDRSFMVSFQPTEKEVVRGTGVYGNAFPIPDVSAEALLQYLSEANIEYTTEIDSPFNTESIYANFKRLLKSETFEGGYRDPVTGKIFGSAFTLDFGTGARDIAKLYLEAYPYRNGSKAVIRVSLSLASKHGERMINVGDKINFINKQLEKIIKS